MTSNQLDTAIFTNGEVAEYRMVTRRTTYRLTAVKKISAFKVGGSWRFSKADIDSWIKRQSEEDTQRGTLET